MHEFDVLKLDFIVAGVEIGDDDLQSICFFSVGLFDGLYFTGQDFAFSHLDLQLRLDLSNRILSILNLVTTHSLLLDVGKPQHFVISDLLLELRVFTCKFFVMFKDDIYLLF